MALGFDVSVDNLVVSPNLVHGVDNYSALRMIEDVFPYCSATDFLKGVFDIWLRSISECDDFEDSIFELVRFHCSNEHVSIVYPDVEDLVYGILDSIEQKLLCTIGYIYPIDDHDFMSALSLDSVYVDLNTVMFTIIIPAVYR